MIVLNLELDNLFGFEDFKINFLYSKKVKNSSIKKDLEGCFWSQMKLRTDSKPLEYRRLFSLSNPYCQE